MSFQPKATLNSDIYSDFIISGLAATDPGASLSMTIPTGVLTIFGNRVVVAANAFTYTASRDTYVDINPSGTFTYTAVANGAGTPAVATNSVRVFKVVTNGTEITSVAEQLSRGLPISRAVAVTGALSATGALSGSNFTGSLTGTNTGDVSIGTANGLSIPGGTQTLSLALATTSTAGALSAADKTIIDGISTTYAPQTRTITAGAGLTGGGDLSANRTLDVVANADGSIVVNANDIQVGILATDAQHGSRGGGSQHSLVVAGGAAGFMSGADKTILDGLSTGYVPVTRTITAGAGLTGGGDLSANRTLDVVANADGSIVVNANDIQVGILASDAQHGTRGGGSIHALAVAGGAAGFLSGSDKTKLDNTTNVNSGDVTIGTANGLSRTNQVISMGLASAGVTGALSGTDWSTFNSKESVLTFSAPLNRSTNTITVVDASGTLSGVVNTTTQTFAGQKTFTSLLYVNNTTPLVTDLDTTTACLLTSGTISKNDSNIRTFSLVKIRPILSTGVANSNTTLNALEIDTTNTSMTGLTTNLIRASYGGTPVFTVTSGGNLTITGSITATNIYVLSSTLPADVGTAAIGVGTTLARADHVHGHGNLAGGSFHALAIAGGAAGFLSGSDKTKLDNTSGTNTGDVTIGTANGLSRTDQVLSMGVASAGVTGALSGTDWSTFNSKENVLTFSAPLSRLTNVISIVDASASVSGVVNTTTQSFAGAKTFTSSLAVALNQNAATEFSVTNTTDGTSSQARLSVNGPGSAALTMIAYAPASTTFTEYSGNSVVEANNSPVTTSQDLILANAGTGTRGNIHFYTGGRASTNRRMTITKDGNVTIDTNVLYVDATNNRVGINKTPTVALDVTGAIAASTTVTGSNLSGTNTGDVTIGTANGLSLTLQALSLALANTSTTGALSSTDWNTFNNKVNTASNLGAGTGVFESKSAVDLRFKSLVQGTGITISSSATEITITNSGGVASGVAGAVQFSGGSGAFSSDATNLFWDDTNNRLGVRTNSPSYPLHVIGATNDHAALFSDGTYKLALFLGGTSSMPSIGSQSNHALGFFTADGSVTMRHNTDGSLTVGGNTTAASGYKLDVRGAGIFSGGIQVNTTNTLGKSSFYADTVSEKIINLSKGSASASFGNPYLHIGGSEFTTNGLHTIGFGYVVSSSGLPAVEVGYKMTDTAAAGKGSIVFATRDVTTDTAPTQRMEITSAGNVTFSGAVTASSTLAVTSNLTVDTNTFFVDATNNRVGVGTASPTQKFQIDSGSATIPWFVNGTATDMYGTFRSTLAGPVVVDNYVGGILNNASGTNVNHQATIHGFGGMGSNHGYDIRTNNITRMTFLAAGNVGIGDLNPQTLLSVGGAGSFTGTLSADTIRSKTATILDVRSTVADTGFVVGVKLGTTVTLSDSYSKLVTFYNGTVEHGYIKSDGSLHVSANGNATSQGPWIAADDFVTDFVAQGFSGSTINRTVSFTGALIAYIGGRRVYVPGYSNLLDQNSDIYVDVDWNGDVFTHTVANGAATPGVTANAMRVLKFVTNASTITSQVNMAPMTFIMSGTQLDSATSVAVALNSADTYSTAGAKLLSIRNNGTEKAYFDKDGALSASGSVTGNSLISATGTVHANLFTAGFFGTGCSFTSQVANSANNIAHTFDTTGATLSASGTKLLSVKNNGTEKFFFDKDGYLNLKSSLADNKISLYESGGTVYSIGVQSGELKIKAGTTGDKVTLNAGTTVVAHAHGTHTEFKTFGANTEKLDIADESSTFNAGAHRHILANSASGDVYIQLPQITTDGRVYEIHKTDANNTVYVLADSGNGDNIRGNNDFTFTGNYQTIKVISYLGSQSWYVYTYY